MKEINPLVADTLIKGTKFEDPASKEIDVYFVTAQTKDGRESRWYPDEPLPSTNR